jgi:CRISPR-associated endonuclease/helicase Cas3
MDIHQFWAKSDTTNGIITLVMHTEHVIKAAINLMERLPFSNEEKEYWQEKIIRCAILHDVGKIHKDFQAKLKPDESSDVSIRHEIISLWIIEAFLELSLEEQFAIATHHKGVIDTSSNYGRLEHPIIKEDLVRHIVVENDLMKQMPIFLKKWHEEFKKYYPKAFAIKNPQTELSKIELSFDVQKLLKKKFQKKLFNCF